MLAVKALTVGKSVEKSEDHSVIVFSYFFSGCWRVDLGMIEDGSDDFNGRVQRMTKCPST